jgi:UDP-N-acetylglucosamine:LPS N-acetylglucosamine transferase
VAAGAADMLEQSSLAGDRLGQRIEELIADGGRLQRMSAAAQRFARPDAARRIVDKALELAGAAG